MNRTRQRAPRPARRLVLGFALGLAALLVAACGGGAASAPMSSTPSPVATQGAATASPAAGGMTVRIVDFAFAPATLTVQAGATVTWTNEDGTRHTVAWADGSTGSGALGSGGTYARTFDVPGTFAYACGIHPAMTGEVVVEP